MKERRMSVGEAEAKAKQFLDEDNDDALFELASNLLEQSEVYGAESDFHNFSLNYSRKDAYALACDVLEMGLKQYPRSVDLLADYLQVGINDQRYEKCNQYYKRLIEIPDIRWTWRGFSFLIDYSLFLAQDYDEEQLIESEKQLLDLTNRYAMRFPYSEDPYISRADIFSFFNEPGSVKDTLAYAVNNIPVCPKCALRLADILFEEGKYEESLKTINKCLYQSIQTQDSVNHAYLYYLSGLCKVVILLKEENFKDTSAIENIYNDFIIAEKAGLNHPSYQKVMQRQIDILETRSGVIYNG